MATPATIAVSSLEAYSATLTVSVGDGYDRFEVFVRTGGAGETGTTVYDNVFIVASSFSVTVEDLEPETTYSCNVRSLIGDDIYTGVWGGTVTFTTPAEGKGPDFWEWWSDLRSGQEMAWAAGGALRFVISAEEWNAFCANINEVRVWAGYSSYSFTRARAGTTPVSAAAVNEAIEAINEMDPAESPPPAVHAGRTAITADFFLWLRDAINSVK